MGTSPTPAMATAGCEHLLFFFLFFYAADVDKLFNFRGADAPTKEILLYASISSDHQ